MTPESLKSWRKSRGFRTQQSLADKLGKARRTIANYESGANPIPIEFRYALSALDAGLRPLTLGDE